MLPHFRSGGAKLIDVAEQFFEARANQLPLLAEGFRFGCMLFVGVLGFFEVDAKGIDST